MNNILAVRKACTGCTSCMHSCPKKAIFMQPDVAGFLYPEIRKDLCTDCGACLHVCPVYGKDMAENTRVQAYYGAIRDAEVVKKSSSGGAFSLMAEYVLSQKGLVCGATIDYETMEIVYNHTDAVLLDEIRRSKYVGSFPKDIFVTVKTNLCAGRLVLFCGLPCHVDGLKKFLKKEYENLITCDFICGGTASPKFFKEHITALEKKYGAKASNVNFRAKLYGWKEHSIKVEFANGKTYGTNAFYDRFFKGYFEKPFQRDSCYACKYRLGHEGDIIVADYWGGLSKGRGNDEGVSMVITNSPKGESFFEAVLRAGNHAFSQMPLEDSDYVFKTEEERYTAASGTKKTFLDLYAKHGFKKAADMTYFKGIWKVKVRRKISNLIHKIKR